MSRADFGVSMAPADVRGRLLADGIRVVRGRAGLLLASYAVYPWTIFPSTDVARLYTECRLKDLVRKGLACRRAGGKEYFVFAPQPALSSLFT